MKVILGLVGLLLLITIFTSSQDAFAQTNQGTFEFTNGSIVGYHFENGDVDELILDRELGYSHVYVTNGDGSLEISIPREILDSKIGSQVNDFIIINDGSEISFYEERDSVSRTLMFDVDARDQEFEIFGTSTYSSYSSQTSNSGYASDSSTVYYYEFPLPDSISHVDNALEDAFQFWTDSNPGLQFVPVSSESQADLLIGWVKDFGGLHVGYNLGNYIEVGLGDSDCIGSWKPYHPKTISHIAAHEIGHYFGHDHSNDPDDLMYPDVIQVYDDEPWELVTAPGYVHFIPLCASIDITGYDYQISVDNPNGFDVYFVDSVDEYDNSFTGDFYHYLDKGCWAKKVQKFSGTCDGVSHLGGLVVFIPDTGGRDLITITAHLQEKALSDNTSGSTAFEGSHIFDESESFVGTSTVSTDKSQYDFGETVNISGTISVVGQRHHVQVSVTDPLGQIVAKSRVVTTSSGDFQTFTAVPNLHPFGVYAISIYNDQGQFLGDTRFSINSSADTTYFDSLPKFSSNTEFKKFQTSDFVIQYPRNWFINDEIYESDGEEGISDSVIGFVTFYDDEYDWDSYFDVYLFKNDQGAIKYKDLSYRDYLVELLRDVCTSTSFADDGYACLNYSTTDSKIINIDGKRGYMVVNTWTEIWDNDDAGDNTFRYVSVTVDIPVGNDVWSLYALTTSSEHQKYVSEIDQMIKSFQILESGAVLETDNVPPLIIVPTDIIVESDGKSGTFVKYSVKAIDDVDGILTPSCSPTSSSLFSIGKTKVTCYAADITGNDAKKSFFVTVQKGTDSAVIPAWIKNIAGFWCNGEIDDSSFIESIQYLINNNVIQVTGSSESNTSVTGIPDWVKNNACWWYDSAISDDDFASGIAYLVKVGIIQV